MPDFLERLSVRPPHLLVGWRAGAPVTQDAWMRRAAAWATLARRTPGSRIALYLNDSLEFAAALLGAWKAGKTIWLAADALPASCQALRTGVDAFWGDFPESCAPQAPAPDDHCMLPWPLLAPDFPALVVYTSGSSGSPKAIAKQLSQLTSEVAILEAQFGARMGDAAIVATVSHQHIYGLLFKVLWPLAAARPIDANSVEYPEALAPALGRQACVLIASPAHLKRLPAHLDWSGARSRLRAVFSSGGPLDAPSAHAVHGLLGETPVEVYGSSESGGIAWRQQLPGLDASWAALPGVAWRVNEDEGQLEVRSPHAAGDDWLQMADRAAPAGEGRFMLQGRSDRIVKVEEKRVSLDAIEAALRDSGLALDARVIACPPVHGARQLLAAFVVPGESARILLLEQGKAALDKRMRDLLAGVVERVALPRRWRYLDQMPVNAQGKTTQAQLLALLERRDEERPREPEVRVLEQDAARVLMELTVPANLLYFDGHFPQAPVLPGVVQLDWAIQYGRAHFALAPAFRGIHALKFQQIIRPGMPVRLELVNDAVKSSLHFRYFSAAGAHASGRVLFGTR